jgi:prepilin-type N-terminal cleavage/methylation domain-containing protein
MKKILNKKGFTLIELIVVIAILAILALILVPSITGYIAKAEAAKNQANARAEYSRVVLEAWTTGGHPVTRKGVAIDPDVAYTLTDGLTCTAKFVLHETSITAFSCATASTTWSVDDDFLGTAKAP